MGICLIFYKNKYLLYPGAKPLDIGYLQHKESTLYQYRDRNTMPDSDIITVKEYFSKRAEEPSKYVPVDEVRLYRTVVAKPTYDIRGVVLWLTCDGFIRIAILTINWVYRTDELTY